MCPVWKRDEKNGFRTDGQGIMDRRKTLRLIGSAVLFAPLTACTMADVSGLAPGLESVPAPTGPATPQRETLGSGSTTVGVLMTQMANLSDAPANSAHLAARLALDNLGAARLKLEIQGSEPNDAAIARATNDLLARGAKLVLVAAPPALARVAASTASPSGIPVISLAYGSETASNLFHAGFDARDEARALATEARRRGHRNMLLLHRPDIAASALLQSALAATGLTLSTVEIRSTASLADALAEAPARPDAIIFATGPLVASALIAALPEPDLLSGIAWIGNSGWSLAASPPATLSGSWYPTPSPSGLSRFATRYATAYGTNGSLEAALAYDLLIMAAALPGFAPDDPYRADILSNPHGFEGFTGPFKFGGDGLVQPRTYAIATVP